MEFNPCEIIRITKKEQLIFPYRLHNTDLKSIKHAKYLRVTIGNDLSCFAKSASGVSLRPESLSLIHKGLAVFI